MPGTILLVGTFDTKGAELGYVRSLIEARGHSVIALDAGVLGEPNTHPEISAGQVAAAAGDSLDALRAHGDRGHAMQVMVAGVETLVPRLHAEGRIDGVLGLGGGGGTSIGTAAMRTLPVGVPKLMVSTLASGDTRAFIDVSDITMMPSVVDIAGLNRVSRSILANAAGAICGMIEQQKPRADDRPVVAATMFGVTTPCVQRVRERLEEVGYEVLVFHATGSGGRAMEALIDSGYIAAVADITTTEWCDEVVGGILSAGPDRLGAAARAGVPQVVSLGALDMVNFGAMSSVPERFRGRTLHAHNPNVTLMRTTPGECMEIGRRIAEQLNRAAGPTTVLVPLRGVSAIDDEGQPFHDPEADAALYQALRDGLRAPVELVELDLHINDRGFADAVVERLLQSLSPGTPSAPGRLGFRS
jgi:uncharacterized protein (UPF0261 family)